LRRARRALFSPLFLLVTACAAAGARAAEPPAIPETPPPAAKVATPREVSLEASIQETWSFMGDWHDALATLEARSRADGLTVTTSNNPAYTTSFDAVVFFTLRGPLRVGLQYDRMTGKSEFKVRENFSPGTGPNEYETSADARSNAWLFALRWMLPGARRGVRPYAQLSAGVGSAQLDFETPSGGAEGKGHGFASNLEAGFQVGDGVVRIRAHAGWRFHRVPLSYSRVRGTSYPGLRRFYFDFDDEARDFVIGRDVDLGGAFGRIGIALVRVP